MLAGLLKRAWRDAIGRLRPVSAPEQARRLLAAANAQASAGRHDLAAGTLERAAALAPGSSGLWNKLGVARFEIGLVDEAIAAYRKAVECAPGELLPRRNLLFSLLLRSESPEELLAEHRACGELMERGLSPARSFPSRKRGEKIRVGYVSGDFVRHAVSLFMEPILARHDPQACEVYCYDNRARGDAVTERLKSYRVHWRSVAGLDDAALAQAIRADGIDVLVDLSGHTAGNRLGAFALRCAPAQVSYLGYLGTTGLSTMDYRLSDALADPPGESDAHYSEKVVRLPGCLWCYRPPLASVAAQWRAQPAIRFGSLNSSRKLSRRIVRLWGEVLRRAEGSRLLIACLPEGPLARRILGQLEEAGVARERIECVPWCSPKEFAALHARVDIGLDSFPCGGGTTTIEALWHGVPVVSLAGATFPSRAGRSILANAGVPELSTHAENDFIAAATALAADPPRIARLHAELPERLRRSPIMDEERFVAGLEQAFRELARHAL